VGLFSLFDLLHIERHCSSLLIFVFFIFLLHVRVNVEVASIDFSLLLEGGEKDVLNSLFLEVLVPMGNQLDTQVVCLVHEQNELLTSIAHLVNVPLQVCGVEEVGVSGVDDLKPHGQYFYYNLPELEGRISR